MECHDEENELFCLLHLLLIKVLKTAKTARDICAVYGDDAIADRTDRDWYVKFKKENFDFKDTPRSGNPVAFDEELLHQLSHENTRQATRELTEEIKCSHTAKGQHLHSIRKVQECGAWVRYALSNNNKNQRATISTDLHARHHSTHGYNNDLFTELLLAMKIKKKKKMVGT
ncbi:histone-lysine N-methyltransferase SETMAR [Nephila pilipes]|uniref:Histone-lysine N-methyltransferase SETMAR n=1 Tax=Nephila pilipes TaxID=299642 RepID=A0A8X6QTM9_NEPPI|nr:histone-lysine N-methyltransferase SETMAR [Nephila pilipes]